MTPLRLALLAIATTVLMDACAPIDLPAPPPGGPSASASDEAASARSEAERRQRRLARKRDKVCEKHPDRCGDDGD